MRISELSRRSGVAVATIKFYLREGVLTPGRATAANQAEYDEDHIRRLRLIRALISVRGLSVSTTAHIMNSLPHDEVNIHRTLGLVLGVIDPAVEQSGAATPREQREVDRLIDTLGWKLHPRSTTVDTLASTLESLNELGVEIGADTLLPYAQLMEQIAELDLDQLGDVPSALALAERAIILTILLEPVLLVLRRMAQEHRSALRNTVGGSAPERGQRSAER